MIETSDLTKRDGTGDRTVVAVDGLDLRIEPGDVLGVLGTAGRPIRASQ